MQLIKVRDNKGRPINNLDLLMKVVFGDKTPEEFVPGNKYQYGDIVYNITEDGYLKVWICNNDGRFQEPKEPNFSEFTLDSLFQNIDFSSITNRLDALENLELYEFTQKLYHGNITELQRQVVVTATVNGFDFNNYKDVGDSLEVYLRGAWADHYILPSEYTVTDNDLMIHLQPGIVDDKIDRISNFYPEGCVLEDGEEAGYWYGEKGLRKTFSEDPINIVEFDPFVFCHVEHEQDYNLTDFKVTAVHTLVHSPHDVPHFDEFFLEPHAKISDFEGTNDNIAIKIKVPIEPSAEKDDILYISYDKKTCRISITSKNGYIKQVKFRCTVERIVPNDIVIVGTKAMGDKSRFIKIVEGFGEIVNIDGKNYVKVPFLDLLQYNSFVYEVYRNRTFTESYEELVGEDGATYLEINEKAVTWEKDTFYFRIYYSISQGAGLLCTNDINVVSDDKEAFRIALSTPFINRYQWLRMRTSLKLLDKEVYDGAKEIAYINNMDWYVNTDRKLRASVFSVIFENIVRRDKSETTVGRAELYPTFNDTSVFPIPFVDYNVANDDFLIFHSTGALISSAKWHLNKHSISFYVHEEPLYGVDYVEFKMLDRDPTFRVASTYLTTEVDYQNTYDIGFDSSDPSIACMLLFTISGEYISDYRYELNGSTLTFIPENNSPIAMFEEGDRFDLVVCRYTTTTTKTTVTKTRLQSTRMNENRYYFDKDAEFNPKSDTILLFQANGMYVGEKFYSLGENYDSIVLEGSLVPKGQYMDVIIFRKTNHLINLIEPEPEPAPLPTTPEPPITVPVEPPEGPIVLAEANQILWNVKILGTYWQRNLTSEGYTKEINIAGIRADDKLTVGLVSTATSKSELKQEKDAFNNISRVEPADGKIVLYCTHDIPRTEITIKLVAQRVDITDILKEED